jgi:hypothetical protein
MHRDFRCKTKKENKENKENQSRVLSKYKKISEGIPNYEKLSYMDIQFITRNRHLIQAAC